MNETIAGYEVIYDPAKPVKTIVPKKYDPYGKLKEEIKAIWVESDYNKIELSIEPIKNSNGEFSTHSTYNFSLYAYHPGIFSSTSIFNINFSLNSMSSGCGSMLLYNWTGFSMVPRWNKFSQEIVEKYTKLNTENLIKTWNLLINDLRTIDTVGPGAIFATAGASFYKDKSYNILTELLGFKVVDEYNNHQHGSNYTQRLLSLHI